MESKEAQFTAEAPLLKVRDLRCGYDKTEIVHGVSMDMTSGEFVCILGPNGCGKTTTLKTVLGLLKPLSGSVEVNGVDTIHMREAERAKLFAYIPQAHTPPFPFTVADVVILGRTPYVMGGLSRVSEEDKAIAWACMERMGVGHLARRPYTELSGGQQQLVLIARALAQEPRLLIMDEPTASLDFGNQQLVLQQMRHLANAGTSVLMVTHDPDHALFCAHRVIVMEAGAIIASGDPRKVLDAACLQRIYHTDVRVVDVELDGEVQRVCIPVQR